MKVILQRVLFKLTTPLLIQFYLLKYEGIWNFKKHLQKEAKFKSFILKLYDSYFEKYGSWIGWNSYFSGVPCFPHGPTGIFISGGPKLG